MELRGTKVSCRADMYSSASQEECINACGMLCLVLAAAGQEGHLGVVAGSSMGPSVWSVVARGCQPERLRVRSAFWLSDSPAGCTH